MHTVRWSKGNRRGDPAHEVRWRREMREAEGEWREYGWGGWANKMSRLQTGTHTDKTETACGVLYTICV